VAFIRVGKARLGSAAHYYNGGDMFLKNAALLMIVACLSGKAVQAAEGEGATFAEIKGLATTLQKKVDALKEVCFFDQGDPKEKLYAAAATDIQNECKNLDELATKLAAIDGVSASKIEGLKWLATEAASRSVTLLAPYRDQKFLGELKMITAEIVSQARKEDVARGEAFKLEKLVFFQRMEMPIELRSQPPDVDPAIVLNTLAKISELAVSATIDADQLEEAYVLVNADAAKEKTFNGILTGLNKQTQEMKSLAATLKPVQGVPAEKIDNVQALAHEADSRRLHIEVYHRHKKYIGELKRLSAELYVQASRPGDLTRGKAFDLVSVPGMQPMVMVPADENPRPLTTFTEAESKPAQPLETDLDF